MYWGIGFGVLTFIVLNWALWIREWAHEKPWAKTFFKWIEPFEIRAYRKSETLIWARWRQAMGYVLSLLGLIGQIDYTQAAALIPFLPEWSRPDLIGALLPLIVSISGHIAERFRGTSTKPLEMVELPDEGLPPKVAAAVEKADVAKDKAVAAVEKAKV